MADKTKTTGSANVFKRIGRGFGNVKGETKKIVWPSKKQVINGTIVVIVVVVLMGLFIWGLDALLGFLVNLGLSRA